MKFWNYKCFAITCLPIFYLQIKILNRVYVLLFIKLQLVKSLFTVTTSPGAPSLKDLLQGFKVEGKLNLRTTVKLIWKAIKLILKSKILWIHFLSSKIKSLKNMFHYLLFLNLIFKNGLKVCHFTDQEIWGSPWTRTNVNRI